MCRRQRLVLVRCPCALLAKLVLSLGRASPGSECSFVRDAFVSHASCSSRKALGSMMAPTKSFDGHAQDPLHLAQGPPPALRASLPRNDVLPRVCNERVCLLFVAARLPRSSTLIDDGAYEKFRWTCTGPTAPCARYTASVACFST
eukprot:6214770-Pleurochrysis_carterae.AAC.4